MNSKHCSITAIFLIFNLLFSQINSSLFVLDPKCPLPTMFPEKCDQSDYQFIENPIKSQAYTAEELKNPLPDVKLKKYKAFQNVYILNPTNKFQACQKTVFFRNYAKFDNENAKFVNCSIKEIV